MALNYVSNARLDPYLKLCGSPEHALELHNETMLVGSSVMSVLALLEIALRNRLHSQIGQNFNQPDWLCSAPMVVPLAKSEIAVIGNAKRQAQQDKYSKLTNTQKLGLDGLAYPNGVPVGTKHQTLSKNRQRVINVTEGEIVAHTTLFFWKRLFAPEYEKTLWKRSVRKLFPNKTLQRATVSAKIETLYTARNRLAHHEPVHGQRLEKAIAAIEFVRRNLDNRSPGDAGPLCKFTEVQFRILIQSKKRFDDAWLILTGGEGP